MPYSRCWVQRRPSCKLPTSIARRKRPESLPRASNLSVRAQASKSLVRQFAGGPHEKLLDRKSTRLNSSHGYISYAVFCLKKKTERHLSLRDSAPHDRFRVPPAVVLPASGRSGLHHQTASVSILPRPTTPLRSRRLHPSLH